MLSKTVLHTPRFVPSTPRAFRGLAREEVIATAARLEASSRARAEELDELACARARVAAAEDESSSLRADAVRERREADAVCSRLARLLASNEADLATLKMELEGARLREVDHAAVAAELLSSRSRIEELESAVSRLQAAHAIELHARDVKERVKLEDLYARILGDFAALGVPRTAASTMGQSSPRAGSEAPAPTSFRAGAGYASPPVSMFLRRTQELPSRAEDGDLVPTDFSQESLRGAVEQLFFVDGECIVHRVIVLYAQRTYILRIVSVSAARVSPAQALPRPAVSTTSLVRTPSTSGTRKAAAVDSDTP